MTEPGQHDFEAVLEHARIGNRPSPEYMERVSALDNVVRECIHVSKSYGGLPALSGRHYYASVLFTALITRGVSLANLAPYSPWSSKKIEHWDYASATGIVRTMLELRFAFYYLCVEECSDVEWNCRWNLFNLHDCHTRRRLSEAQGATPEKLREFDAQEEELRCHLKQNAHFASLAPGNQRKLLNGQAAYLFPLEEIAERAGVARDTFRWLYILFSSHVHGLPMSFYRIGSGEGERGRGLPSPTEEGYTSLCLSLAVSLLVRTRDEVHVLFAGSPQGATEPVPAASAASEKGQADDESTTDALPAGQPHDLLTTDLIRVEANRVSSDAVQVLCYHRPTNEVVLKRTDTEVGGAGLEWFDPVFWNVLVNGAPATENLLESIVGKSYAFKVDVEGRTVHLKVDL